MWDRKGVVYVEFIRNGKIVINKYKVSGGWYSGNG